MNADERTEALGKAIVRLVELAARDEVLRAGLEAFAEVAYEQARGRPDADSLALETAMAVERSSEGPSSDAEAESALEAQGNAEANQPTDAPRVRRRTEETVPMSPSAFVALLDDARRSIEESERATRVETLPDAARRPTLEAQGLARDVEVKVESEDRDAALPRIVASARLRALVARDVADRARNGGPLDESHLHQARSEGAPVWMIHLNAPDAANLETFAACLGGVADAAEVVLLLGKFRSLDQAARAQAVRDLAAVQSALRIATSRLRQASDEDQLAAFAWLRDVTRNERIYVQRHMQLDDPLDPADLAEVMEPVHATLSELKEQEQRDAALNRARQRLRYHARQFIENRGTPADGDKVVSAIEALVAGGTPVSSLEFRDALYGILDSLPLADGRSTAYARVRAELDLHRARVEADDRTEAEDEADPLLAAVRSPADAVRLARERLSLVVIPEAATSSVATFDSMPEAAGWGRATWRALSALDAYAAAEGKRTGFWDWCANSGSPRAWPATPKRLSMTESDTVKGAFVAERTFAIDAQVRPEGKIVMLAHCKLGGGGSVAPRLYFHDDTKGATGKVHIGFIGPHREVPNASTN